MGLTHQDNDDVHHSQVEQIEICGGLHWNISKNVFLYRTDNSNFSFQLIVTGFIHWNLFKTLNKSFEWYFFCAFNLTESLWKFSSTFAIFCGKFIQKLSNVENIYISLQ